HHEVRPMKNFARALALLGAACTLLAGPAHGQAANIASDFPTKPIRVIVTFPPGGSADAVVRMLVPKLNDKLGQAVIIDNRPGAGGNVGLTAVAKAPGDGYTLGVGAGGRAVGEREPLPQHALRSSEGFQA